MFEIFKRKEDKAPNDVKGLRDALLRMVKEQLQKSEGGEGRHITCRFRGSRLREKSRLQMALMM